MAQGNINLTINGNSFGKQKIYNNIFENSFEVDNTDGFITGNSIAIKLWDSSTETEITNSLPIDDVFSPQGSIFFLF